MSMHSFKLNSQTQKDGNRKLREVLRATLPEHVQILAPVVGTWVHAGSLGTDWAQARLVMNGATLAVGTYIRDEEGDVFSGPFRLTAAGIAYFGL